MRLPRRRPGDCRTELKQSPVPLYSEAAGIGLLWSAKAGCTFAVKWLYFQEGILEEALAYDPWPHRYRQDVYYSRPGYLGKLDRIPLLGERVVKFVRNPYDRVVSSYLFLCEAWSRPELKHRNVLDGLRAYVGRPIGHGELFTFREFVGFLSSIDLDSTDIHLRRQIHACERSGDLRDMTIVRIEESEERLPDVERQLGLRSSDYDRLRYSKHHTERAPTSDFVGDKAFATTIGVATPPAQAFYDDELLRQIAKLYGPDLERYGYGPPS